MATGNRNILNSIKGITSVVKLTAAEKTALADRVLPANVLVVDSSNIIYLTDGVTAVKALNPLLASATKLQTARTINGTSFDGTANITTANWGTARNISITDGTNTSTAVSVNGSANVSLNLPATIKATFVGNVTGNVTGNCSGSSGSCTGNAATATQFSANATVALTGDATGTSAGSKKGWSVPVTLANSGVTAGTYGPSADVTGNNNATISVPQITVDAKGRVTSVVNRTLTCKNNTYTVNNATLTIQKNGSNVATFTSNASANATANITVPTKTSELTNDSGFLTSHQSLSNYVTLNGAQTISGAKTLSADTLTGLGGNGYRIINGSSKISTGYGVFQRIDSGNWYLMVTAKDDALGSWTTARPAQMALSTGILNINGNAATATTATNATNAAKLGNIASSGYVQTGKVNQTIDGTKTFSAAIASSIKTNTYIDGNKGVAIINSTASAGYNMLYRIKSTNGVFTGGVYNQSYELHYTVDTTIAANTNAVTYTTTLMNEAGDATFAKNVTINVGLTVKGDANFTNITASYITGLFE